MIFFYQLIIVCINFLQDHFNRLEYTTFPIDYSTVTQKVCTSYRHKWSCKLYMPVVWSCFKQCFWNKCILIRTKKKILWFFFLEPQQKHYYVILCSKWLFQVADSITAKFREMEEALHLLRTNIEQDFLSFSSKRTTRECCENVEYKYVNRFRAKVIVLWIHFIHNKHSITSSHSPIMLFF